MLRNIALVLIALTLIFSIPVTSYARHPDNHGQPQKHQVKQHHSEPRQQARHQKHGHQSYSHHSKSRHYHGGHGHHGYVPLLVGIIGATSILMTTQMIMSGSNGD